MSRFLRNKRDILLSLFSEYDDVMNITKEIRKRISNFADDYVFTASDFDFGTDNQAAVVKALNRMAKSGEITKLSKGKFYKPRKTQFGELRPSAYQIAKDYIEKDGKKITVKEEYHISDIYGDIVSETVPYNIDIYVTESDLCYKVCVAECYRLFDEHPGEEWLLSFGMEPYVPEDTATE